MATRRARHRSRRTSRRTSRKGGKDPSFRANAGEVALRASLMPTSRQPAADTSDRDFHRRVVFGLVLVALLFVGFGGWAASASLSGAVIAPGRVVIESSVKKIQHL